MASKTLGRYELICEVAKGQLGPLWAAFATGTDNPHPVLIRRVSTAAPTTPDEIDSLSEGAWWMLEVQDSGIAHGVDVVKTEGELGVVTEYAEGEVMRSLLRLASFKRKPISVSLGTRIAIDILEALGQAMAQADGDQSFCCGGLVPDSVLVGRDGHTRLLDIGVLGAAARVGPIARHPEMASYMAPETLEDSSKADMRSNLYSVGVMVWEMLSGKRLFVGSTHQAVAEKVKAGGVQRLDASKPVGGDAIPREVADVIAKALELSPDARFESPKAMIEALEALGTVAERSDVAHMVEDLAGNTLASRRKLVEKALLAKPLPAAPKHAPVVVPKVAAPLPKPEMKSDTHSGDLPPPPKRKPTLIGLSPVTGLEPPPRKPLESLDEDDLESISKIDVEPFPTSEPPTKPAPKETKDLVARMSSPDEEEAKGGPEPIKTSFLGTPAPDAATAIAAATAEAKAASPKPPEALPKLPLPSPKPADVSPKPLDVKGADEVEEVPVSMDLDMISEPPPPANVPEPPKDIMAKQAAFEAKLPERVAAKTKSEPDSDKPGEKNGDKKDESAVAWVGPPPGVALETREKSAPDTEAEAEEPVPSIVPERTLRLRKMVALGIGSLIGLMALGIAVSRLGKKDEGSETTQPPKTEVKKEEPKAEEPKKEEPKAEEPKKEEPKAEEPKAEEPKAEEPKKEEPKTEVAPTPTKTVTPTKTTSTATKTTSTATKTTSTATKTTTTTKPKTTKTKPKFTPSGI